MGKYDLDYILVPLGLLVMIAYHVWLLHRIIRRPSTTLIGINALNRRLWVRAMMQDTPKNGVLAVQTLRNNIMASTVLASTAIMLSSVIAILMSGNGSGYHSNGATAGLLHTDISSKLGFSIKFCSILVSFLLAFLLNLQSIRYYSHASILINVPCTIFVMNKALTSSSIGKHKMRERVTAEYVGKMVNQGSYFWSLGLRAFYLSFPLFLWIFGPVPMVMSCLLLVFLLYFLDVSFECGMLSGREDEGGDGKAEEEIEVSRTV